MEPQHLAMPELEAGLDEIRQAPAEEGVLKLIVRRPEVGQREVLDAGELDVTQGLLGDTWQTRGAPTTPDGSSDPDCQITIMSSRAIALLAQAPDRWALAGDQLNVDMDLSHENVPAGTKLAIGEAVVLVTEQPHNGCKQFAIRYGKDAVRFVNSPQGKQLRLRGLNSKVVRSGAIRAGDTVRKVAP